MLSRFGMGYNFIFSDEFYFLRGSGKEAQGHRKDSLDQWTEYLDVQNPVYPFPLVPWRGAVFTVKCAKSLEGSERMAGKDAQCDEERTCRKARSTGIKILW